MRSLQISTSSSFWQATDPILSTFNANQLFYSSIYSFSCSSWVRVIIVSTISTFCPFHNHQLSARQEQPVVPLNCTISTEIRLCLSLKNSLLVTITIFICCCFTQKKSNLFKWHSIVTRYRQF